ncbi:PAS domain-containing sensor histidine kinase [Clostridium beijerinckii]|uniref:PAS domain-containing sensor histidine kinase n=1 Tax=Clostridium beijerinckii TaxID=1520 RepID=UPI00098C68B5|nr:PAS domain-containing sensor histidine kinase [Clostridium beijerinckii]NRT78417.1 PAS domain S-box-containing protein [Clostridium beijerinckii]OOM47298.1 sensor histidine kinase TmoS [Clostridium beijerinckii]
MSKFVNKKIDNLSAMLAIIKVSIVMFISIIVYINMTRYFININIEKNGQFNVYTTGFFFIIIGICCIAWLIITSRIVQSLNIFKIGWVSWFFENTFYISIISIPMYLLKFSQNEYKYLFLLVIIFSTIQYGSRYGIITSIISSSIITLSGLLYAPLNNGINENLQGELIFSCISIFIAWIIGYYVDMEKERNRSKDKKLQVLRTELDEVIKERCEIESLLLKNKFCYDMIFENSLNALIVHENGVIIYANESAAKLLGYKNPIDLNGRNFYDYYTEDVKKNIQKKYSNIIRDEFLKIVDEENILNCEGNLIPVRNTSAFFTYKETSAILTLLIDITSEKKLETLEEDVEKNLKLLNETREFNNLITIFFTNMSHELKTPVNVIYAAVQTISIYLNNYKSDDTIKCKSYLKIMKQNCLRMIRLINNLLDITKLDSGFIKLNRKNDNIVSVIEDIVQSVALYVKSKNIKLIFDTDIEEKIMGFDHDMMERIMLNLISNALKYSHSNGNIYINIIDEKSRIIIKVKDEGEGMPQNKLDFIFERFGQINNSLSRQCEGSGIGLYLVKSFIEMHNGRINVKSIEGKGSEFTIILPVELAGEENYVNKVLFKTHVERIEIEFSDIYSI